MGIFDAKRSFSGVMGNRRFLPYYPLFPNGGILAPAGGRTDSQFVIPKPPPQPPASFCRKTCFPQGKTPWLVQLVLTVCFFFWGIRCCRRPLPKLRLEFSDCGPELAFASWPLGHSLGSAAHNTPTACGKTGRTAPVLATQGSTRRHFAPNMPSPPGENITKIARLR